MDFRNSTELDSRRLEAMFVRHAAPFAHDGLTVRVRYSRGADFSGTCFYRDGRIFINLGRHLRYPYMLGTHLAKAQSDHACWWREVLRLTVADAYQLALFIFLHELFHYLVKAAGRCPRRKEAMCDRFAAAVLVDEYHCRVHDTQGRDVPRSAWHFQDLMAFVARAPRHAEPRGRAACSPIPVRIVGAGGGNGLEEFGPARPWQGGAG